MLKVLKHVFNHTFIQRTQISRTESKGIFIKKMNKIPIDKLPIKSIVVTEKHRAWFAIIIQPIQETDLIRAERIKDLQSEIHKLHPRQQQAMLLRYFEKMPLREISEVLECSEGQIKSLLFRGLKTLRQRLPRQGRWDQELNAWVHVINTRNW